MKNGGNLKIRSTYLWCLFLSLTALIIGCSNESSIVKSLESRYLFYFTDARSSLDITDPELLTISTETIENQLIPVTRVHVTQEYVTQYISLIQPLQTNRNHRLIGVSFFMRSSSGSCILQPVITPEKDVHDFYFYPETILLNPNEWKQVELYFSDFSNTATLLHLEADSFQPVHWKTAKLIFLFMDIAKPDQLIEIGPVELLYQTHRYNFY